MKIVVGTRGSNLAVTQTNQVIELIKEKNPGLDFHIKTIKTKGDMVLDKPIDKIGGKEIFIKEIEKELLDGTIHMAVHSMKDVPGELPKGLKLSYIPKREDHRDVIVLRKGLKSLDDLPRGGRIGTGSKRRKYQLLAYRDDLEVVGIRGNVQTRICKIESENLDGVVLAAAGIKRLGLDLENTLVYLDEDIMVSSPCQGVLGLEIREDNEELDRILRSISHRETEIQTRCERSFLQATGGSCSVPVGGYCSQEGDQLILTGILGNEDGTRLARDQVRGSINEAEDLGRELAKILIKEIGN